MKYLNWFFQNIFKKAFNSALLFLLIGSVTALSLNAQDLDVPYVPTPPNVVEKMLDMANVQKGDYVIDLGSGDGRIVIAAVKRGAYGHGIDLDPERIKEARENAEQEGLENKVAFLKQDIFETDFSQASVVTMYLLTSVNQKLRPELLDNLEPGTRVVSHSFAMDNWKPDKKAEITAGTGDRTHDVYYWVIPAKVEGSWSWQLNNNNSSITIDQQFQEIDISGVGGWNISEATLKGKRISFEMSNGNITQRYSGRVEGDSISGMVQIYTGNDHSIEQWSASRQ